MKHTIWGSSDVPILLPYQYEPLVAGDALRILHLEPANDFHSPLHGFMTQQQLTCESIEPDGCLYSAVSYTWGDPTISRKLFLSRKTKWSLLPITKNADLLLRHLRDARKKTPLWIDGVCLNQGDHGEKAQQIPLMGQIYAHANRVHIWLGDEEIEDAQKAFSLIRIIEIQGGGMLRPGNDDFLCLERFFNRPWFTRRWIIQETFFAHDAIFHCGHHTISLSRVMAVLANAHVLMSELPGWGSRMLKTSIGVGQTHRQGLLSLLSDLHESECSDERDRIAAVYNLADNHERPPLHYDNGNWKKMYTKIASWYLNNDADAAHALLLHLCDFGSIQSSTKNEVPSWVPNWSTTRQEVIPFHALESLLEYSTNDNRRTFSSSWIGMKSQWHPLSILPLGLSDSKQWKQKLAQCQWREGPGQGVNSNPAPMQFEVSGSRLRLNYDFFTFTYGCGTVDHVVCPALSEDFWEEIAVLFRRREKRLDLVKGRFKTNGVVVQASKRHQMEIESLSSLLVGVVSGRYSSSPGYILPGLRKPVRKLCAGLHPRRGHENNFQALTSEKLLLQRIRSAVNNLAIMRVQATMGYYWAIGPPNLVKGDWLIPIIAQGDRVPRRPEIRITRFMFLRPINSKAQGETWYPSPTSDPESRLRGLLGFRMTEVDAVNLTAKFAGAGGSCLHSFDYNLRNDTVMWRVLRQTTEAAKKRGLPGPVTFDIV